MEQALEAEKLLLTCYEANKMKLDISSENIHFYVYLLRNNYRIPFYYAFRFNPLPYSEELTDDLESLKNGGNIFYGSPILVTDKGRDRVEYRLAELTELSNKIENAFIEMLGWDNKLLFKSIYNTITI